MSYTGKKGRVLLANTDTMFIKGLRSHLESAGYEVVYECSNGNDALKKAIELQPDAVISGIDVTRQGWFTGDCNGQSGASGDSAGMHHNDIGGQSVDVKRSDCGRSGILHYAAV